MSHAGISRPQNWVLGWAYVPQTPSHLPKLLLHALQVLATQQLAQLELKLTDHILVSRQDTGCGSPASHCLRAGPPLSLSSPAQYRNTLSTHHQGIHIYDEQLMRWLIGFLDLQVGSLCTGSILCEEGVLSRRAVCASREGDLGLLECSGRLPFAAAA